MARNPDNAAPGAAAGAALVTVVIVTYRSKPDLPACLRSVMASTVPVSVLVVDNDSGDGTLELAQELAREHAGVEAIPSGGNIGLAAANNFVLPQLASPYVLILNPDTTVEPDALARMIAVMEADPQVGVVGPLCVYENGERHTSYHHGWGYGHLVLWRLLPYSFVRRLYDRWARYRESDVFFVSGACLLMRSGIFRRIGGYDPRFFLTVEDAADLCLRAARTGCRVRFLPTARIRHLCGRSGELVPYLTTLEGYRGSIYYFEKHRGRIGGGIAFGIIVVSCLLKTALSFLKSVVARRDVDRRNLGVYLRILPMLLRHGPGITRTTER